jgi:hypothetical protein
MKHRLAKSCSLESRRVQTTHPPGDWSRRASVRVGSGATWRIICVAKCGSPCRRVGRARDQDGGGGRWDSFSGFVTMKIAWIRPSAASSVKTDCGRPSW